MEVLDIKVRVLKVESESVVNAVKFELDISLACGKGGPSHRVVPSDPQQWALWGFRQDFLLALPRKTVVLLEVHPWEDQT